MKTKMTVLVCIAITAMLVLPMSALAATMTLQARTDRSVYYSPPVVITAEWTVTDPYDFVHDYCEVWFDPNPWLGESTIIFYGDYDSQQGGSGDIDVFCGGDAGVATYDWNYDQHQVHGVWYVNVTVIAYDTSQSPPDDEVMDYVHTATFELN